MKKGFLTDEMLNWLYSSYPSMTNEQLANELSEMIKKENEKEIPRLNVLLDTYLPRLIRAGHRIAICDQLEAPKPKKQAQMELFTNA